MKRAACLLLVATVAVGAVGCGGGGRDPSGRLSKSAYQAKLRSLSQDLSSGLDSFAAFRPSDLAAAPGFLSAIADTLAGVAATLEGVNPPKDVQTYDDRLIEGASTAAAELRRLVARLKGAPPARMKQLLAQFDPARLAGLQELEQAAAGLVSKGYRFSST